MRDCCSGCTELREIVLALARATKDLVQERHVEHRDLVADLIEALERTR